MADHRWEDDALRGGGRAWMAGVAFTCAGCGVQRRMVYRDEDLKERVGIYFRDGKRVKGGVPACMKTT